MTEDEARKVLGLIHASWPTQQMTPDVSRRWLHKLAGWDFTVTYASIDALAEHTRWRPEIAQVADQVRAEARAAAIRAQHPSVTLSSTISQARRDLAAEWLGKMRDVLGPGRSAR